ncbi:6-phospho-beta-glucosidase [Streptomyces sp. NPDC056716]|uniref:6-phospho-beta-glucosidase n=1 Tax=unclassified Streptomyces TaxID=2593676 RepID=UPI003685FBFD
MAVKIAVIGGGSTYTPELVDGFARFAGRLPVADLVLHDIDAARLEPVAALAGRILRRQGWQGRLTATGRLEQAVEGADFVVVQLRVGGQQARLLDETLPLEVGCVGQETTGAGGFAKALRTVPVVLDLAEQVAARAADGAWLVDFTNPVGIVTQALLDEGHRAIGLCNVAIGLQRRFAELLRVAPERVALEHVGLNHLTWERAVTVDGRDLLPELLDRHLDALAAHLELPGALLRDLDAIPSRYLRFYYRTAGMLAEQRAGHIRAREVQRIEDELLALYRDPALDTKPAALARRGGTHYSEAAVQLIASLYDDRGDVQVVNVRNEGAVPGLPADAVVEIPARITSAGADPLPARALPAELLGLVQQMKAYERLAVTAARTGDHRSAVLALMANPLVGDREPAVALLDSFLRAHQRTLPDFWRTPDRTPAGT